MNDIEILNRQIEDTEGTKIMKQAIENLIARNKELEEKNKELEGENEGQLEVLKILNEEIENRISKNEIKEKIEEYDKMIQATYKEMTHQADIRRDVCIEIKNQLQELLQ